MGQPPAQGSGVDVEGTGRAALPILGCPLSVPVCPVAPFSSPTAGTCALGTPGLLCAGEEHSPRACGGLTNLGIPCVCWGSPHGRGSVSEGWSTSNGQGLAD